MYYEEIHIGKIIQFVFHQSGFTISEFARMLGVQRTRIYGIFDSKTIDIDLLCNISDILHYDFLEVYIKKREVENQQPNTINVHFQVLSKNLADFIKFIDKMKKAGIIKQ